MVEYMHDNPERLEQKYGRPYEEIRAIATENLIKAGCPEDQIEFVLHYGGMYEAYENNLPLDLFKKDPYEAIYYLTTD